MKTYKIIGKTDGYIASRDPQFNGKAMLDGWKKRMDNETSAKWWIDNRNEIPTGFINATSESAANSAAREIVRGFRNLFAA